MMKPLDEKLIKDIALFRLEIGDLVAELQEVDKVECQAKIIAKAQKGNAYECRKRQLRIDTMRI